MLVQNYFHHDYSIQSLGLHKRLPTNDGANIRIVWRLVDSNLSWIDLVTESQNIFNDFRPDSACHDFLHDTSRIIKASPKLLIFYRRY